MLNLCRKLTEILIEVREIKEEIKKMAVTLAQVDAAIAAENTSLVSLAALATKLDADVTALAAKVGAGQDFTAELDAVQANAGLLATVATNVQSADTSTGG